MKLKCETWGGQVWKEFFQLYHSKGTEVLREDKAEIKLEAEAQVIYAVVYMNGKHREAGIFTYCWEVFSCGLSLPQESYLMKKRPTGLFDQN